VSIDLGFDVWTKQRIRISGIDAAEKNTTLGQEALKFVNDQVPVGCMVKIQSFKKEKFGRYLAHIVYECNGASLFLDKILIDRGYAVNYDGKSKRDQSWVENKLTVIEAFPHG
jgi:endonuclease YncB( thermonuclease family)